MVFSRKMVSGALFWLAVCGCVEPTGLQPGSGSPSHALAEELSPNRSQQVMLEGPGWGRVQVRQRDDGILKLFFITWLRELQPGATYLLQYAYDYSVDGVCSGGAEPDEWLTAAGNGKPWPIVVNDLGSIHLPLSGRLPSRLAGRTLDLHFRLVNRNTGALVMRSGCFQMRMIL